MSSVVRIALFVILGAASTAAVPPPDTSALIEISGLPKDQYYQVLTMGLDIVERHVDTLRIIAHQHDLSRLAESGVPYDMVAPDAAEYYRPHTREATTMGGFMTYDEITEYLDLLAAQHQDIMTPKFSIGQSLQGNDLWCVKVSDNPAVDEDEPEVLYISLIHAREPAGAASLLYFLQYLLDNYGVDPEITDLVNNRELFFVPVQNPDGYIYNEFFYPLGGGVWRKNMRDNGDGNWGVDLNRNYGFEWGYDEIGSSGYTGSETYRGQYGFSEPETQAIRDFVAGHHISIIHNFHTFSNLEIWPWSYDYFYSSEEQFYANLGDSMTQYNYYSPGVAWDLYATNGDADDWAWGDTLTKPRIISLTVEIGTNADGFWPDPSRIPTLEQENLFPNLFLAKIADNPYRIAPPHPPVATGPGETGFDYTITWHGTDSANPAASYTLTELSDRSRGTDDAEIDYGDWNTARFTRWTRRAHSGEFAWHEMAQINTYHWLLAKTPYEIRPDDSLVFWLWYDIEQYSDYFYAQISVDGGETFINLANNLTSNSNPYHRNHGNGITGTSPGWVRAAFDLSPWVGQQAIVRLAYLTDEYGLGEGVYIDDIENCDRYGLVDTVATGLADTSYSFTEKPWGDYWYRVNAVDSQNQVSPWSQLAWARAGGSYLPGDADGSGDLNIADVTYLVTALFKGGPWSVPDLLADADCSGDVNIADLTYLVSAVFQGGPMPNCF